MIQITPQMRLLVAIEPVDFRRGIDGLAQVCRAVLSADLLSALLPQVGRRQDRLRLSRLALRCGRGLH